MMIHPTAKRSIRALESSRRAVLLAVLAAALGLAPAAIAQQSANYRLTEWTIDAGGDPLNGSNAASTSFKIKIDAIGDGVLGVGQASASFHVDSGFADVYAPPGEIQNQRFTNASTMTWDPEKSVGVYEAFKAAKRAAAETGSLMPPAHIRNAPTKLMKQLGYGKGYQYDPDTEEGFSGANFFPDEMERRVFYKPRGEGHEEKIKARLERWAAMRAAINGEDRFGQ